MKLRGPDGIVDVSLAGVEVRPDGRIATPEGVFRVEVARDGDAVWVTHGGRTARYTRVGGATEQVARDVRAPMTGRVVAVHVSAGAAVKQGDVLVVLEAMKMEYRLEAPREGVVQEVHATAGILVELGQALVTLE